MKKYEEPKMDVIRFEMAETLTSDVEVTMSGMFDYGEGIENW